MMKRYEYLKLNPLDKEDFKTMNSLIDDFPRGAIAPCQNLPDCPHPEKSCKDCAIDFLFKEIQVETCIRKEVYSSLITALEDFESKCDNCPGCEPNRDCSVTCFAMWLEEKVTREVREIPKNDK